VSLMTPLPQFVADTGGDRLTVIFTDSLIKVRVARPRVSVTRPAIVVRIRQAGSGLARRDSLEFSSSVWRPPARIGSPGRMGGDRGHYDLMLFCCLFTQDLV
jgi:hypothetical protein